jgi:hypothetical protein
MSTRAFVVRVIEPADRVVVEDVRSGESAVVEDLQAVAPHIERWLGEPRPMTTSEVAE